MEYWDYLDELIKISKIIIDRPKGSCHPRYPELIYPLDYGFLGGTNSMDLGGIDLFLGSLPVRQLSAVILTIDLHKKDAEVKLIIGCTEDETRLAHSFLNNGKLRALLVHRDFRGTT